jgi:hypothetical protein
VEFLKYLSILFLTITIPLSADTHQQLVRACEEAIENQSLKVYLYKQWEERQRQQAKIDAWNAWNRPTEKQQKENLEQSIRELQKKYE